MVAGSRLVAVLDLGLGHHVRSSPADGALLVVRRCFRFAKNDERVVLHPLYSNGSHVRSWIFPGLTVLADPRSRPIFAWPGPERGSA